MTKKTWHSDDIFGIMIIFINGCGVILMAIMVIQIKSRIPICSHDIARASVLNNVLIREHSAEKHRSLITFINKDNQKVIIRTIRGIHIKEEWTLRPNEKISTAVPHNYRILIISSKTTVKVPSWSCY